MIQTCSVYLNVFHPFASLYENRLCIHRQSQELHCVDSPWNGSEQSLIALAATVSLLALSIIISNLPDQIAALCRVDITTSLIAILKPSFHSSLSPPHISTSLSRMASDPNWDEAVFTMYAALLGCCMWNVMSTNWTPKCLYPSLLSFPPFL